MFSLKRLIKSFGDALRGVREVFKSEQNFRLQVLIAIFVILALIYFPLRSWERIILVLLIMAVLAMELLNSAFERLSDLLKPRLNHYIGAVKDIMAAAVLLTSVGALVIGIIILWPHFIGLLK